MMRFNAIITATAFILPACSSEGPPPPEQNQAAATTNFGDHLPGLSDDLIAAFELGLEDFLELEEVDEGLGPVFNDFGCGACHDVPATGGSGATLETRFGRVTDGVFDPLEGFGGSLIQVQGFGTVGDCTIGGEVVPPDANRTAGRRTQALFGLGLVDAVPDSTFVALALAERFLPDGIAGRASRVVNTETGQTVVGKFGWKAQVPTLHVFSGDAYVNEMGITSPFFPAENCPGGDCDLIAQCDSVLDPEDDGEAIENFNNFMTLLAPPPRPTLSIQGAAGAVVFAGIGCASCHTPALRTGSNAIPQLDRVTFFPFSDFLLHDMGSLGDGMVQGTAGAREMRTQPLWGVSQQVSFLHDGRATTIDAAIREHAGQGQTARDRFVNLSSGNRAALLQFLNEI